jgi:hypothetical protein
MKSQSKIIKELIDALQRARTEIIELTDAELPGNKIFYPHYIDKVLKNAKNSIKKS